MLFLFCALLVASFHLGRAVVEALDISSALLRRDDSSIQILTAINIRSEIERRDIDFTPKHNWDHHYADHVSLLRGASARFAKTSTRFKIPALALEEIESQLDNIVCSDAVIVLEFVDELTLSQAKGQWDGLSKFIVISSHPSCNEDGERAPYVVSDVSINGLTATFSVQRVEWKAVYASMKVDFGMTDKSPGGMYSISGIRLHDNLYLRLGRRQVFTSTGGAATSAAEQTATSSTIAYPSAPTSAPSSKSSSQNISFSFINQPSIVSWNESQNNIGCKNCSLSSSVEITHGTFIINSSTINEFEKACKLGAICQAIEEADRFVQHGFFSIVVDEFRAHMELNNSILLSTSQFFSQDIFTIGLPGFQIPNIAVVGPQYNAAIIGSIDVASQVNFTYGFDITIPDGSSININIGNLTNSTQHGFSNSTIKATPFTASTDALNLSLSLGLRSEVLLGVNILSGAGSLSAGAFLDLPLLSVNITTLNSVNAHCEPLTNTSNGGSDGGLLSHVFPRLTHLVPTIDIGFGLAAAVVLDIAHLVPLNLNLGTQSIDASTTLAGTAFPLPTACLSWDEEATRFVQPAFTTLSMTKTAVAATTTGVSAGAAGTGAQQQGGDGQKAGGSSSGGQSSGNAGTRVGDQNPFVQRTGGGFVWAVGIVLGGIVFSLVAV